MSNYIAQLKEDMTNADKSAWVGIGTVVGTSVVCRKKYKCDWIETALFGILGGGVASGVTHTILGFDSDEQRNRVLPSLAGSVAALGTVVLCRKKYKYGWLKTILLGMLGNGITTGLIFSILELKTQNELEALQLEYKTKK